VDAAARAAHVHKRTIWRDIGSGKLKAEYAGARTVIWEDDLEKYIAEYRPQVEIVDKPELITEALPIGAEAPCSVSSSEPENKSE
jgi:hypothetical protein